MKYLKKAGYFVALLVFLFLVLGPFIWTFVISITPEYAMFAKTTELLPEDVDILDDRLRGNLDDLNPNLYYQITMTFNPVSATHWIKARYFDKSDPDVLTHHSTYRTNRFIDPAYSRRMERRKEEDPDGYRVYGLGEWGELGGLILTNNEYLIKRINSAIFPGTQGGPLEHVIAAKAVCFGEALKPEFKEYARKIVENAKALEAELTARGVKLVSGGTDNHLLLIDLTDEDCTGKELEHNLDEVHITANKNTVPGEKRSPFVTSGVRIGTPAVTTRGMGVEEMKIIADCIADCIFDFAAKKDDIAKRVADLTAKFPLYE